MINFTILNFNEKTAQLQLNIEKIGLVSLDIPIDDDGNALVGEHLINYINESFKYIDNKRAEKLNCGISNKENITKILNKNAIVIKEKPQEDIVREYRNNKLKQSDWTQLCDSGLNEDDLIAWNEYRQALRDIPMQSGFPNNLIIPLSPKEIAR